MWGWSITHWNFFIVTHYLRCNCLHIFQQWLIYWCSVEQRDKSWLCTIAGDFGRAASPHCGSRWADHSCLHVSWCIFSIDSIGYVLYDAQWGFLIKCPLNSACSPKGPNFFVVWHIFDVHSNMNEQLRRTKNCGSIHVSQECGSHYHRGSTRRVRKAILVLDLASYTYFRVQTLRH